MFDNTDLPLALIMEEFIYGKTGEETDDQANGKNTQDNVKY